MRHFQGVRTVLRRGLSSVGGAGVGSLSAVVTEPRSPKIDELGRAYGTGRRKTSVARVWIRPGDGKVRINGKSLAEAFPRDVHQDRILDPLFYTTSLDKFDVWGTVQGGGISGQAGAFCHGLARALDSYAVSEKDDV
jgi:small subunit ribosomal protein S9